MGGGLVDIIILYFYIIGRDWPKVISFANFYTQFMIASFEKESEFATRKKLQTKYSTVCLKQINSQNISVGYI